MKKILAGFLLLTLSHGGVTPVDSLTFEEKIASDGVMSDPINLDLIKKYDQEVRENPSSCKRRWQRSLVLLKHGQFNETTAEDIDTLLWHPLWRTQGERLKALYLYQQGHMPEAEELSRQNIRNNVNIVEQSRLLAGIALARRDTVASLAAYRFAWDQYPNENVYIELLNAYRGHGKPPEKLLQEGVKLFPQNAGVMQALFETYYAAGKSSDLQACLKISGRAGKVLWPRSVDWKIMHARALIGSHKSREAEAVLLAAVDLMDEDPRLEGENGKLRREVFALLEKSRDKQK